MRRSEFFVLVALLCFGVAAYSQVAASRRYYPKGGPDTAEEVSLIQLIANPKQYDGKKVRITGFLNLQFEGDAIYLHREDFEQSLSKNALWIDIPDDMTRDQREAVNDKYVICTGTFVAAKHRAMELSHKAMYSGEMSSITRLEVWAPPKFH